MVTNNEINIDLFVPSDLFNPEQRDWLQQKLEEIKDAMTNQVILIDSTDPDAQANVRKVRNVYALETDPVLNGLPVSEFVTEHLENEGETPPDQLNVDGSSTPVAFSYSPPEGFDAIIGRVMIYYSSSVNFSEEKFAHLTALANGVEIWADGVLLDTWKDNVDVITDMFDLVPAGEVFTKQARSISGRWTFHRAVGASKGLIINNGNDFNITINDDLTSLTFFHAVVQGALLPVVT